MKEETTTRITVTVSEIIDALRISGVVVSCGFNTQKKFDDVLDRELTIVVEKKVEGAK